MKAFIVRSTFFQIIFLLLFCGFIFSTPKKAGFYLPESIREVSFNYRSVNNLIVLPVVINNTLRVNLILDTGCRNLVLFGGRFKKLFDLEPNKKVQFSGLGAGKPVFGNLSLNNTVTIDAAIGETIPVVIVPNRNLFSSLGEIDGVIGYDIFVKFEIEINPLEKQITFRPAAEAILSSDYERLPLRILDAMPILDSHMMVNSTMLKKNDLMIDTGSSLALLLKTIDLNQYKPSEEEKVIGEGFNGLIKGFNTVCEKLILENVVMDNIHLDITKSPWHNYASIGMGILKDYALVLNYCKSYAGIKRL